MTTDREPADLVVAVARLGEADLAGWWRSHGLDEVGEYVLPELFPRTATIAGAELAVLSAAKRHRDALPDRDDVVHLFGEPLPAYGEAIAWLAELKTGGNASFLEELRGWSNVDTAHENLVRMTGAAPSGERIGATLRLGKLPAEALHDLTQTTVVARALAASYAGQGQELAVPYFDLA
jgi:hypothetical protein